MLKVNVLSNVLLPIHQVRLFRDGQFKIFQPRLCPTSLVFEACEIEEKQEQT